MSQTLEVSPLNSFRSLLLLAAWALAMFGTLQVHQWEDLLGHSICGPWGCGPPTTALISYHGFWLILLLLPAWLLIRKLSPPTTRRVGTGLLLIGIVGIALLLAVDGWQTWQHESLRPYMLQRVLFRLATFVDFPLAQLALVGVWLRGAHSHQSSVETNELTMDNE